MARLAADPHAFIRPSPSAGTLGGVARATVQAMAVLEAAAYDVVLVETVGVGQSEVTVAGMVDTFLFLTLARTGDQLQGIKKGILEIADVIAVNKADGDREQEARVAARDLAGALRLVRGKREWAPPVVTCSALDGHRRRRRVGAGQRPPRAPRRRRASPTSGPTSSSTSPGRWSATSSTSGCGTRAGVAGDPRRGPRGGARRRAARHGRRRPDPRGLRRGDLTSPPICRWSRGSRDRPVPCARDAGRAWSVRHHYRSAEAAHAQYPHRRRDGGRSRSRDRDRGGSCRRRGGRTRSPKPLAKNLVSPLSAAVADDGTAYVTQNFAGLLSEVRPGKKPKVVYASEGGNEVGGVSVFHGKLVFAETGRATPRATRQRRGSSGSAVRQGPTRWPTSAPSRTRKNPDETITYGVRGHRRQVRRRVADRAVRPADYRGVKDSHPYATLQTDEGTTFVADAGMNAVLAISPRGRIRTVAVAPAACRSRSPTSWRGGDGAARRARSGRPTSASRCPTDLALKRRRQALRHHRGRRSRRADCRSAPIYRVGIKHRRGEEGRRRPLRAGRHRGRAQRRRLYVSQLFGGEISRIKHGTAAGPDVRRGALPAAVEWTLARPLRDGRRPGRPVRGEPEHASGRQAGHASAGRADRRPRGGPRVNSRGRAPVLR